MLRLDRKNLFTLAALGLCATLASCGGEAASDDEGVLSEESAIIDGDTSAEDKSDRAAIVTTVVPGFSNPGSTEVRRTFTNAASFRAFFGQAPTGIDFTREWASFYGAGRKPSGGYKVSIPNVRRTNSGLTLKVTTALEYPGAG